MEHRWGRRVAVDLSVRIEAAGDILGEGRLRDISASGAFIETPLRLGLLTRITVIPCDSEEEPIESAGVPGHVVRLDGEGVGLEWCEFAMTTLRLESLFSSSELQAESSAGVL